MCISWIRDKGLNHSQPSRQLEHHVCVGFPSSPGPKGVNAKGPVWILCTLGFLWSLGTLSLGTQPLLRQTSLPWRETWPYPSRLLTANMTLRDGGAKSSQGSAFLAGTLGLRASRGSPLSSYQVCFHLCINDTSCYLLNMLACWAWSMCFTWLICNPV